MANVVSISDVTRPMHTAPRDETIIAVLTNDGWRRVFYCDCRWLREGPHAENIPDCWRSAEFCGDDIELSEARGWKPAQDE